MLSHTVIQSSYEYSLLFPIYLDQGVGTKASMPATTSWRDTTGTSWIAPEAGAWWKRLAVPGPKMFTQ